MVAASRVDDLLHGHPQSWSHRVSQLSQPHAVVISVLQGMPVPEEGPLPHHLQDIPRLLFAAGVSALRKPARLLLPPTAVLYIARCAGETAAAALRVQDGALALAAGVPRRSIRHPKTCGVVDA